MNSIHFYQGIEASFFLAPSGQRFTSISLAQNFANIIQKKEKLAKAILEDKARALLEEDKAKTILEVDKAKAILEDKDKSVEAKGILEDKSRQKMSRRTGKRKGEEGVDSEPEAKKQKLEEPAPLQLSKEVILRR